MNRERRERRRNIESQLVISISRPPLFRGPFHDQFRPERDQAVRLGALNRQWPNGAQIAPMRGWAAQRDAGIQLRRRFHFASVSRLAISHVSCLRLRSVLLPLDALWQTKADTRKLARPQKRAGKCWSRFGPVVLFPGGIFCPSGQKCPPNGENPLETDVSRRNQLSGGQEVAGSNPVVPTLAIQRLSATHLVPPIARCRLCSWWPVVPGLA